jgi:hypothetical protein
MRPYALALVIGALMALETPVSAQHRSFGGYRCTQVCDLHAEGFKWARVRGVGDKRQCPYVLSKSFQEGCLAFIQNPSREPDEDDEGNPVGAGIDVPANR